MSTPPRRRVGLVKRACNLVSLAIMSPCALSCWAESRLGSTRNSCFDLWVHVVACLPGPPGMFLRRAFYRWTLEACAEEVTIGFGALFSRRSTRLEHGAYVGPYAIVGSASIGENSLIGSRASLLSGGHQHRLLPSGEWSATDERQKTRIEIGSNTWVGEAALLMANVGSGCMVAAGAVVSSPVPSGIMVGGNPARFVQRLVVPAATPPVPAESSANEPVPQPATPPVPGLA
jgi:virginiamycin A acetyltransferase